MGVRSWFLRFAAVAAICSGVATAGEVAIKPGLWDVTTTTRAPMMPREKVHTTTECITEERSDPTGMMAKNGHCKVKDRTENGNTVKWKIDCTSDFGPSVGSGEFTSEGKTAHGKMEMTMSLGGETMEFKSSWKGEYLGECK